VATPAIRRDDATGADVRLPSAELLGRLDEPVRAVADGQIRKIVALPQGGFAVVTAHEDGWVSILSGLREVEVAEGYHVDRDVRLGGMGRNLDGAPILSFALVYRGHAVDPAPVLAPEKRRHHHH
jgi:septal ring factor EnvC (AmiA/AmiB activator)